MTIESITLGISLLAFMLAVSWIASAIDRAASALREGNATSRELLDLARRGMSHNDASMSISREHLRLSERQVRISEEMNTRSFLRSPEGGQ